MNCLNTQSISVNDKSGFQLISDEPALWNAVEFRYYWLNVLQMSKFNDSFSCHISYHIASQGFNQKFALETANHELESSMLIETEIWVSNELKATNLRSIFVLLLYDATNWENVLLFWFGKRPFNGPPKTCLSEHVLIQQLVSTCVSVKAVYAWF